MKLAGVLDKDELEAVYAVLEDDLEKTAEEEKMAELEAQYAFGEYTAAAFVDELEKIAQAIDGDTEDGDLEKVAADYETLGREMAHEYFAELVKEADEEGKTEEGKEDKEDKEGEESKEDKMKRAKEKLLAAVVAKQAE